MTSFTLSKTIHTIDLNFMGLRGAIAVYLIPHRCGAVLVECGPGSTFPRLEAALKDHGYALTDITDVFLTHIHLDHAGAAGRLSQTGSRIHVHPVGAPHLTNPEKLLTSAGRIYGDMMQTLWGEFLPVAPDRLEVMEDGEVAEIEDLHIRALDTPGHAYHHYAYFFEDVCFSGDIAGVRMSGVRHVRLPMPPPELQLKLWRQSLEKLKSESFNYIAPTHFGLFSDPQWHLAAVETFLDEIDQWIQATPLGQLSLDEINRQFLAWTRQRSSNAGVEPEILDIYEAANPSWMSSQGILRYWQKFYQQP
jgi:glyoxylase-like metal-dependent hydrolase (beta-lactamase superfamily II)